MHLFGEILGYLFMLVWVPYAGFTVGRALMSGILPAPEVRVTPTATPKAQKKAVKTSKSEYQVIDSFRDEHRITNPVEFDA
tara:strand:- start:2331 stop:2573 length:243 start_codon:yes stop_codon:yes gene_type:complete